ncbi:MAG: hypothetical protein WAX44_03635 [Minisyncoccia bacterium]
MQTVVPLHPELVMEFEVSYYVVHFVRRLEESYANTEVPFMCHVVVVAPDFTEPWNIRKAVIHYELSSGDRRRWFRSFDTFARAKMGELLQSLRPGSRKFQVRSPHNNLYLFGKKEGSMIVTCSGNYEGIEVLPSYIAINCHNNAVTRWMKSRKGVVS